MRLEGQTDASRVNFRYVVALLLVRRRRFKMESGENDDGTMTVRCVRDGQTYSVTNPRLSEEEMSQVQDEVFQVLGWN
jgi:hypothetical protein